MLQKLDLRVFLAFAIVALVAIVILVLLLAPVTINEKVSSLLLTAVGVLLACFKDVYAYVFGSSQGSKTKDDTLAALAKQPQTQASPPSPPQS